MLAGTDEAPGETEIFQGQVCCRGMDLLQQWRKLKDCYFQGSVNEASKLVPEGIEGRVYKGSVADMVFQMIGGIQFRRVGVGAATIQDLYDCHNLSKWARRIERRPSHDVQQQYAPNYRHNKFTHL